MACDNNTHIIFTLYHAFFKFVRVVVGVHISHSMCHKMYITEICERDAKLAEECGNMLRGGAKVVEGAYSQLV